MLETPEAQADETRLRLLTVVTVDVMAYVLLRPWLLALRSAGHDIEIACSVGEYADQLRQLGFVIHDLPLRRTFNPFSHITPLVCLYHLIRRGKYDVVNAHSPVGGALGRAAAFLGRCPTIAYTVHGFYFHDDMNPFLRRLFIAIEWLLGRGTDWFMFVSDEDRTTALREGIASDPSRAITIFNGVDTNFFSPDETIEGRPPVVGIVGRIVREKGYREFLKMATVVAAARQDVRFLVVGDSLQTDRDQFGAEFREDVRKSGLGERFTFTGFTKDVAMQLRKMTIFTLPSYREGFPRSVLEAMSCGLPVIATAIRGCREAVVDGETGLIVPPRDSEALARAVLALLDDSERAHEMGKKGRQRAVELFDQELVKKRFLTVFKAIGSGRADTASALLTPGKSRLPIGQEPS